MAADDGRLCGAMPPELVEKYFFAGPSQAYSRPAASVREDWAMAKTVCQLCPILDACRRDSPGEEFGVWGGTDQYERHWARRGEVRRIMGLPWEEQLPYAAEAYRLYIGGNPLSRTIVAMRMGITPPAVAKLAYAYRDHLEGLKKVSAPAAKKGPGGGARKFTPSELEYVFKLKDGGMAPSAIARRMGRHVSTIRKIVRDRAAREAVPPFPSGLPDGDGWIRYEGSFYRAHYVGETADGAWVYVKFDPHLPIIKWMPAAAFELRVHVTPVVMDRAGKKGHAPRVTPSEAA